MLLEIGLLLIGMLVGGVLTSVYFKNENKELVDKVMDLETKCKLLCDHIDEQESKG
jgi:hypothetical protein